MASILKPKYKVIIQSRKNKKKKLNISKDLLELTLTDAEDEFAYRAEIKVVNYIRSNKSLASYVSARDIVKIYASVGNKRKRIFSGIVWQKNTLDEKERTFTITAYDKLIYLQKSEGSFYFKDKQSSKTIMKKICKSWHLKLSYTYRSNTHKKLKLSGDYASFISDSLLDKIYLRSGYKGIVRLEGGVLKVFEEGNNSSYYSLRNGTNIISNEYVQTMDEMITQVRITGWKKKKKKTKSVVIKGKTKKWGTLQKLEEDTGRELKNIKRDARRVLRDKGHPQTRRKIVAYDIPFIRKGDKISVNGTMSVVRSITHNFHEGKMELEVVKKKKYGG